MIFVVYVRKRPFFGLTMGICFIGVCIPWQSAHVSTGRKDRKSWEDHLVYCRGLTRIIEKYRKEDFPVCVLGDYNQRIPRVRQPVEVAKALAACFPSDFSICTAGMNDLEGKPPDRSLRSLPGFVRSSDGNHPQANARWKPSVRPRRDCAGSKLALGVF